MIASAEQAQQVQPADWRFPRLPLQFLHGGLIGGSRLPALVDAFRHATARVQVGGGATRRLQRHWCVSFGFHVSLLKSGECAYSFDGRQQAQFECVVGLGHDGFARLQSLDDETLSHEDMCQQ